MNQGSTRIRKAQNSAPANHYVLTNKQKKKLDANVLAYAQQFPNAKGAPKPLFQGSGPRRFAEEMYFHSKLPAARRKVFREMAHGPQPLRYKGPLITFPDYSKQQIRIQEPKQDLPKVGPITKALVWLLGTVMPNVAEPQ